ncbi:MAG: DUF370 domain-containing protein [Ruminococcus sp.]|nr:DUF370 domain-containing protein [Ruminococcus sp.]
MTGRTKFGSRAEYLHIGGEISVDMSEIIGIFDMENTTVRECTRRLLAAAEKEHRIVYATRELPRSFVITESGGKARVWVSQLAAATLRKRLSE